LLKKATCNVLFVLCLFLASSSDQCPLGLVEDPSAQYCEGKVESNCFLLHSRKVK